MDKRDLDLFAQPIVDIFMRVEERMLINIARKLKGKRSLLEDDPDAFRLQMLDNLGLLRNENLEIIRREAKLQAREINQIILDAGLKSLNDVDKDLINHFMDSNLVFDLKTDNSTMKRIISAYQENAKDKANITNMRLLINSEQVFVDLVNDASMIASTGTVTSENAMKRALVKMVDKGGIPALITSDGRRLSPEGYFRTVMRSTTKNLANEIQDQRFTDYGIELVEISSHAGNRPGCQPYAGRIFALKEGHPKYPYLYDPKVGRIGDADSLFGINCGHNKYAFIEGVSIQRNHPPEDLKKDNEIYEQSQKQRLKERNIRKAKKELEVLQEAGLDTVDAKMKVRKRQAEMREFINETGRTRRSYREQIVKGAGR